MIGDACAGAAIRSARRAGPVGFGHARRLRPGRPLNECSTVCPRQPVATASTAWPTRRLCPEGAPSPGRLDRRLCNHLDSDGDTVGDICDTCPFAANGEQITDGGMQDDDADGDFVRQGLRDQRGLHRLQRAKPFSFFEVAANGPAAPRRSSRIR